MSSKSYQGGCCCGHTRYALHKSPLIVHACHCRLCQRQTGSTHVINLLIEANAVELLTGRTHDILVMTPSGKGQKITRCNHCESALWSVYKRFDNIHGVSIRFVRGGTLDLPHLFPPDINIYTDTQQPHASVDPGIRSVPTFYDLKETWSPESLNRLAADTTSST